MSDTPTIANPAASLLATLPDVTPEDLETWPAEQRAAYLEARAELMREVDQIGVMAAAKNSPAALLEDLRERAATARAARVYEERRTEADKAYRAALEAHGGDTRVARMDLVDGGAVIVRAPEESEISDLETKLIRLQAQSNQMKAQAEIAQEQRWAWEKCVIFPRDVKALGAKHPLIWGDIRGMYNSLGRGVEDARRGKF